METLDLKIAAATAGILDGFEPQSWLALDDPTAGIDWPIPLAEAEISEKDRANPALGEVVPMPPKRTLVLGGDGQLEEPSCGRVHDPKLFAAVAGGQGASSAERQTEIGVVGDGLGDIGDPDGH